MIELRWNGSPHFMRLEYRSLIPTYQASGAWGEPSVWSEWTEVSIHIPEAPQKPSEGAA
jgi:hypothetical protein